MREQISPNAYIITHTYQGETRDPIQPHREKMQAKYAGMSAAQCRDELRKMGAMEPDAARARVWDRFSERERALFLELAKARASQANQQWGSLSDLEREKTWRVIQRAATWGDAIRGALQ